MILLFAVKYRVRGPIYTFSTIKFLSQTYSVINNTSDSAASVRHVSVKEVSLTAFSHTHTHTSKTKANAFTKLHMCSKVNLFILEEDTIDAKT